MAILKKLSAKSIKDKLTTLFIACFFLPTSSNAQSGELSYKIVQNGKEIGWIDLKKNTSGPSTTFSLVSEVKKRLIFLLQVNEKVESEFKSTKLIRSTSIRKINGETTVNSQLLFDDKRYKLYVNGKHKLVSLPDISNNMLTIYFQEPLGISQVYSDNYQIFVNIERKAKGEYKISLPDGNENYYYYKNGVCSRVKVNHSLYSFEFILKTNGGPS